MCRRRDDVHRVANVVFDLCGITLQDMQSSKKRSYGKRCNTRKSSWAASLITKKLMRNRFSIPEIASCLGVPERAFLQRAATGHHLLSECPAMIAMRAHCNATIDKLVPDDEIGHRLVDMIDLADCVEEHYGLPHMTLRKRGVSGCRAEKTVRAARACFLSMAREMLGMSLIEIARKMDFHYSTFRVWERRYLHLVSPEDRAAIAAEYKVLKEMEEQHEQAA